ncbi:thioredoxin domain-containing protein [Luteolibacter sp. LG18]|uniref:thioredoxin domain-containing protein n=1 Tax=Luteolibacter sp. LG18 TaxID=2819286 RepID=UPI002B2AE1DA|nr:hypothetical protein llg_12600 [Luteolibacter sp. LG18]
MRLLPRLLLVSLPVSVLTNCERSASEGKSSTTLSNVLDSLLTGRKDDPSLVPKKLPSLDAREVGDADLPGFIDQKGKLAVLLTYRVAGEGEEPEAERKFAADFRKEMAAYSDVAALGLVDSERCRILKKEETGGVPRLRVFLEGREMYAGVGGMNISQCRNVVSYYADSLRKGSSPGVAALSPPRDMSPPEYASFVATPNRLIVVVYQASWYEPGKSLEPIFNSMALEFPGLATIGRFDIDASRDFTSRQGVTDLPDVRFFVNGKQVERFKGLRTFDQIRAIFHKNTQDLRPPPVAAIPPGEDGKPSVSRMKKGWMPPGVQKRSELGH